MKPRKWLAGLCDELMNMPGEVLALRLTLVLLILHGGTTWMSDIPLRALCGLMLLSRGLLMDKWLWTAVAALTLWVNAMHWAWIDNHKFLIGYWSLACAVAVSSGQPARVLAFNGKYLIGLAFVLATFWKVIGMEYFDGSFLHFTMLSDARLEVAAAFGGNLPTHILEQNRILLTTLKAVPYNEAGVVLESSSQLAWVALISSYWTLFIEGAIAVAFMLGAKSKIAAYRDIALFIFILTTYMLLPVTGFAFVLCVMGLAQCDPARVKTRITYLILFIVVQFTLLPWTSFVDNL